MELHKYYRNPTEIVWEDSNGNSTYPFAWSPFPQDVRSYRQCLLNFIVPKDIYETPLCGSTPCNVFRDRFFKPDGGYIFLVELEQKY